MHSPIVTVNDVVSVKVTVEAQSNPVGIDVLLSHRFISVPISSNIFGYRRSFRILTQ